MSKQFQNVGHIAAKPFPKLISFFRRHLPVTGCIYDHGCGYGGWTRYLAELTGAQFVIYDPDTKAQQYTQKLLGEFHSEFSGPYDSIICFGVLELFDEKKQLKMLKELREKLKADGTLLVKYHVYNPLALRWLAIRLLKGDPISWHERYRFHRNYLSRHEVEQLFLSAGFIVVERLTPFIEGHLPSVINRLLAPLLPCSFHEQFFYALNLKVKTA